MGYTINKVYIAVVDTKYGFRSIHFRFRVTLAGCVLDVQDVYKGDWFNYLVFGDKSIHHVTTDGTWTMCYPVEGLGHPLWSFETKDGRAYSPNISGVQEETSARKAYKKVQDKTRGLKGKHYDAVIMDDMVDALGYAVTASKNVKKEVKQVTKWYERTQGIDFANPLQPKIQFTSKKEVKGKMYLQLIDVIFFNRNTKEIDFRENVVAKDSGEAYLVAVQKYGKYDPRVHVKAARCLLGFAEKEEEEEG